MTSPHPSWHVYAAHAIFATEPAPLWKLLADFNGLPALLPDLVKTSVTTGEGVGAVRTLTFADGGSARENLIAFHPDQFRQAYAMENPDDFPWEHYFCTQQLQPLGAGQTHLMVIGYCQTRNGREAEARGVMKAVYHGLFAGLARTLGVAVTVQPE
jgi:hypothetical protein